MNKELIEEFLRQAKEYRDLAETSDEPWEYDYFNDEVVRIDDYGTTTVAKNVKENDAEYIAWLHNNLPQVIIWLERIDRG